jgi:hypothetical protein
MLAAGGAAGGAGTGATAHRQAAFGPLSPGMENVDPSSYLGQQQQQQQQGLMMMMPWQQQQQQHSLLLGEPFYPAAAAAFPRPVSTLARGGGAGGQFAPAQPLSPPVSLSKTWNKKGKGGGGALA